MKSTLISALLLIMTASCGSASDEEALSESSTESALGEGKHPIIYEVGPLTEHRKVLLSESGEPLDITVDDATVKRALEAVRAKDSRFMVVVQGRENLLSVPAEPADDVDFVKNYGKDNPLDKIADAVENGVGPEGSPCLLQVKDLPEKVGMECRWTWK